MITNTSPHDYNKRVVVTSRLERLCEVCGEHVFFIPRLNAKACSSCNHIGEGVEVWEHMAHVFRRGLMEKEIEKALAYARCMPDIGGAFVLYPEVQS
jgi:hypothetical protein